MEKSLDFIDERVIAEEVRANVTSISGIEVPVDQDAELCTVGPGWRIWGVEVHRVGGALNINVELIVTLDKKNSIPSLSTRVRRKVRTSVQALTSEQVHRIDLRIVDIRFKD
jgi:uncharacterized alkaline shock family protein YloU